MTDQHDQLKDLARQLGLRLADLHELSDDTWAFIRTLRTSKTFLEIHGLAGRLDDHIQELENLIEELRRALGVTDEPDE